MDSLNTSVLRDNLFGSEFPQMFDEVTIALGAAHVRGEVLGIITASGKAKLLDVASADGSQNFYAVLTEDVDATTADKVAPVAIAGSFQSQALTVGGATVLADYKEAARALNCYVQTAVVDNNVVGG